LFFRTGPVAGSCTQVLDFWMKKRSFMLTFVLFVLPALIIGVAIVLAMRKSDAF